MADRPSRPWNFRHCEPQAKQSSVPAIRAGYSRRGAGSRGWTLRQKPAVELEQGGKAGEGARRIKVKLADKSRNLELISRHLGLFPRATPRPRDPDEGAKGEAAAAGDEGRELSDVERHQEILAILAGARTRGAAGG